MLRIEKTGLALLLPEAAKGSSVIVTVLLLVYLALPSLKGPPDRRGDDARHAWTSFLEAGCVCSNACLRARDGICDDERRRGHVDDDDLIWHAGLVGSQDSV